MRIFISVLLFCVIGAASVWALSSEDFSLYQKANEAYRQAKYQEAIRIYEDLTERNPHQSSLLYNLANTYYRTRQLGKAILFYERALMIEPRHLDARSNLDYVISLLEYRVEDKRNWYIKTGEKLLERFTEEEVIVLLALCYGLFMGVWSLALFFRGGMPWGWKRKTILGLTVISLLLFLAKNLETRIFRDAIVVSQEAEVRYGPSDSDQTAFRLGEGIKVYVLDRRPEWSRIILVNGKGGWVRNHQVMEVIQ